jgi:hypothetical protein
MVADELALIDTAFPKGSAEENFSIMVEYKSIY